jgi:Lantibiotic dehydratase, N terminus/Lantibiotic biosynthesis dehydratase C-term
MKLQTSQGPLFVHPHYVLRVAGEPAARLGLLASGATAAHLATLQAQRQGLRDEAESLRVQLERIVQGCDDKALSRAALNAKRAVFNLRPVRDDHVELLLASYGAELGAALRAFNTRLAGAEAAQAATAGVYEAELADATRHWATLWAQPRLQLAMSYTHGDLFRGFEALARNEAPSNAKARRKLEDTFVQYLARCSSKTSPLSAFTVMHVGRWGAHADAAGAAHSEPALDFGPTLNSHVRFKGALLRQMAAPLLARYELASQLFPLALNASARFAEGRVRFRAIAPGNTGGGRSWGTGETVVEMAANAAIRAVQHVYAARGWASMPAADLLRTLQALLPRVPADTLTQLVQRLYELNLLLPDTDDHGQVDALDWISGLLQRLQGDTGALARDTLARIRAGLKAFALAQPAERSALADAIAEHTETLRNTLGAEHHRALEHPQFFENCYLGPPVQPLAITSLAPYADALGLLMQLTPLASFTQAARCNMADFFLARHGADGVCDDVPAFIDAFDEIHGIGSPLHTVDPQRLPARSDTSRGFAEAKRALEAHLAQALASEADVALDASALAGIAQRLPQPIRRRGNSQCFLGQIAQREGRPLFVLNQILGGRSALMSRFLEVLPPAELAEVRRYLRDSSETGLYAELPGVFGFNANHHPQLADHELHIPPSAPNWSDSTKLDIARMQLVYDAAEHNVRLRDEHGRDLDVWYQGFLMPSLLPRLHRVLALTLTEGVSSLTLGTIMQMGLLQAGRVARIPRLSLGDVVIERRQWLLPPDLQPDPEQDALAFFEAMQALATQHTLPRRFFMRVLPLVAGPQDTAAAPGANLADFDFRSIKPLFVDIDSPRLVRLMQRALKRNRFPLALSEVLPALDDQHVRVQGQHHVAELQFELSTVPVRHTAERGPEAWQAVRVAYFDDDKRALLLGPLQAATRLLAERFGITQPMVLPHWKFGPHVDLVFRCDDTRLQREVLPALRALIEPWLALHPSTTVLQPQAYEALSRQIGMSELEPGPYLPLLPDNSVTLAAYRPSRALPLPELVDSKERFLAASLAPTLALLALKDSDSDSFLLTLAAMMGMAATTYEAGGFDRGYFSFRSHAEFFFAAYDSQGRLRQRFDSLGQRLATRLDAVLAAVREGRIEDVPLDVPWRGVLRTWRSAVASSAERHRRIVREHYDTLLADQTLSQLAREVHAATPQRQRIEGTQTSAMGTAFASAEGLRIQRSREFIAYRNTVNFFYLLLPILGVSPQQKFCLCHLVAGSAERLSGIRWRDWMGLKPEQPTGATT